MDIAELLRAPLITSIILAANVISLALVTIDAVHPLQLAYSSSLVFEQKQYWRLITNFFFIGKAGVDALLTLMWLHTTSSELEEGFFMGRPLDYALTLVTGGCLLLAVRIVGIVEVPFLSVMFSSMRMYIYSRLGPNQVVNMMALFEIRLPLLPAAFMALTVAFSGVSMVKPLFIANLIGHVLWYFLDVFPRITGYSPLKVQRRLERMLGFRGAAPLGLVDP